MRHRSGPTQSTIDKISGKRFGKLVAGELFRDGGRTKARCVCDCGRTSTALTSNLLQGFSRSCGCEVLPAATAAKITHGLSGTSIYNIYHGMINRCYDKTNISYRYYGARGVSVCPRWLERDGVGFTNWLSDIPPRPPGALLDRYPKRLGNYEPGNVRWANIGQSNNNKTNTVDVTIDGVTKSRSDWAREFGLKPSVVRSRMNNGDTALEALTRPLRTWPGEIKPPATGIKPLVPS